MFWTFSVAILVWLVAVLVMAILVYGRFVCNPQQLDLHHDGVYLVTTDSKFCDVTAAYLKPNLIPPAL